MKKRKFISLFYALSVIVTILIFFSISLPKKIVIFNQSENNTAVGEIYGDRKIGQTFIAEYNNLSAVKVLLATYNRENHAEFIFHLKSEVKSKEDIHIYRDDTMWVQDNKFFRFPFPKIKNSKRKRYFFYLDSPQSKQGNAITIWSNTEDLYKEGEKIVNGAASEGDLVFKTEYERGLRLSFVAFLGNISKFSIFLVNIFGNKFFYFLFLIIISIWAFGIFSKKLALFNKKGGFILAYCILVMTVSILIIMLLSKKIVVSNQYKNTTVVGEIYGDTKAGQTFVAEYDNLSAIEVLLATYDRKNSGEFIFHLKRDLSSEEDLYNYKAYLEKVKNHKYNNFKFPKIINSNRKKFYFYFEAPQSQPGNAITIWCNSLDLYKDGEKIINGVASEGDFVFKTTYNLGLKNNFNIFLEEIIQNKPSPLNKKLFYIILILVFVLSSSLFMTFLAKFFIKS